jgi:hypothetical protein
MSQNPVSDNEKVPIIPASQSELDALAQLTDAVPKLPSPKRSAGGAGQPHPFRGDLPAFEPGRCGLPGCGQLASAPIHRAGQPPTTT